MDESTFDTLTRSVTTAGSRRRALGGLLLGPLGLAGWLARGDATAHDLSKKCKKKSGDAKKKCLKKARKHNAQHVSETSQPPPIRCTPDCAGKVCGDDGCGGICGVDCSVCQTCSNGQCGPNRAADDAACNGTGRCLNGECNPRPDCGQEGSGCWIDDTPCCAASSGCTTDGYCSGSGKPGEHCYEDAGCTPYRCVGYRCQCTSNGAYCGNAPSSCCAGTNQCIGNRNTTCVGLGEGAVCTFDEQCASIYRCYNGRCGSLRG